MSTSSAIPWGSKLNCRLMSAFSALSNFPENWILSASAESAWISITIVPPDHIPLSKETVPMSGASPGSLAAAALKYPPDRVRVLNEVSPYRLSIPFLTVMLSATVS